MKRAALKLPPALRALRHRNFKLFFGGQLISMSGTWMQTVAQSWLVYRLTGSAVLLGFVGFSSQIPVFLLAPLGGSVADRHNRHRIIICTQTASMILAFTLAAVTLAGVVRVWQIFVLAALLGMVNGFDIPNRQAFVVEMVGKEDLMNAIALNSALFNSARTVGPAVAGVLVATVGEGWCFFINAVSYLAVIGGLLAMRLEKRAPRPRTGSTLLNITEGFRFCWRTGPVRALLLLLALISLMGVPYAVLMPLFADRVLHGGARALGLLMACSGIGALVGALVLAGRRGVSGLGNWVAYACAGFGASLILFASSRLLWLSSALLLPVGFGMIVEFAASNTLIQAMVPDHLRGRTMAVYSMMVMGMSPVGALLAGTLADSLGAPATLSIGGAACILGGALFASRLPAIRAQTRELITTRQLEVESRPEGAPGGGAAL